MELERGKKKKPSESLCNLNADSKNEAKKRMAKYYVLLHFTARSVSCMRLIGVFLRKVSESACVQYK